MLKLKFVIPALIILPTLYYAFLYIGGEAQLIEDHSDLDPKKVIRVYRQMMRDAFTGKYANIDIESDEAWEREFLKQYHSS